MVKPGFYVWSGDGFNRFGRAVTAPVHLRQIGPGGFVVAFVRGFQALLAEAHGFIELARP